MQTKPILKVLGTLLFLYGVFGYIFPDWGTVQFTNNENLLHVLLGLLAMLIAQLNPIQRKWATVVYALLFLAWGIYGFSLKQPEDFRFRTFALTADEVDNYTHAAFGLAFTWFALKNRRG